MGKGEVAATDATSASRNMALWAAVALVLSAALHVVPQLLRDAVNPAFSMLGLMVLDACVVALIVRSRSALLVGILLVTLLGATMMSHRQVLAAVPSMALNLMLAGVFAATLRPGQTPLIVRIAELDAGNVPTDFARYLRGLTQAWAIFFAGLACLSLLLMLYAPFEWWSLFVNVLTWPLIGAMFAAEWVVRRLAFKQLPPHTPLYILIRVLAYQRQAAHVRARAG